MAENIKELIIILGGAIIKDKTGNFRMATFDEGDDHGASGDYIRAIAAGYLYRENPDLTFVVSGNGHGENGQLKDNPEFPLLSAVVKRELIDSGIPEERIIEEKKSNNTYQQLREAKNIIIQGGWGKTTIISNLYHLPRIEAMIGYDDQLKQMFDRGSLEVKAAEDILMDTDSDQWQTVIEKGYEQKGIQARIELERQGVRQIKEGNYNFK